jgi:broad specificity phosphatase PhoE
MKRGHFEKEIRENTGCSKSFDEKFNYSSDPEEIESLAQIHVRVKAFLSDIASEKKSAVSMQNCIVISHYAVLKTIFMRDAFDHGFEVDSRAFDLRNCGIVVIEIDNDNMHVVATNGFSFAGDK